MEKFLEEINFIDKCGAPKKTIKRQPQYFYHQHIAAEIATNCISLQNRQCEVRRSCMRVVISLI